MNTLRAKAALAVVLWLLGACAKQAPPPGGPEDRVAPALESVDPPAGAVGVARTQPVRLVFSKSMQRSEVERALHFFPPPASPPDLNWEGHQLVVTPDTAWDSGQTYVVTLQSEASDVRGNRLAATIQTAFSTGASIDSGRIEGQILSDSRPVAGAMALCYRLPRFRLNPESDTADYVVQADSTGRFAFAFLRPGEYRIFGLDDRDRDWLWNIGTEDLAVPALDVTPGEGGEGGRLPALHLASLDTLWPALLACEPLSRTWLKLGFDRPLDSAVLDSLSVSLASGGDTLRALHLLQQDSLSQEVFAEFPALPAGLDHADVLWSRTAVPEAAQACALELFVAGDSAHVLEPMRIRPDTSLPWPAFPDQLTLHFDTPLDSLRPSCFGLARSVVTGAAFLANPFDVVIPLARDTDSADSVVLVIAPLAVHASGGAAWPVEDSLYLRLPVWPRDSAGEYEIVVDGLPELADQVIRATLSSLAVSALADRHEVKAGQKVEGTLARGDYSITLLADRDGNGRWSAGWPSPFIPSERLWFPPDTLRVRARFTTEFRLSLVR